MAWLSGWRSRIPITIDPTTISGGLSENLTNFPILLKLSSDTGVNSADITRVFDELTTVTGTKKIAVTTSDGVSQCYVEIENWDWGNEEAWLWTKIPTIASGTETQLYLYYDSEQSDNTTYIGETISSGAQNVWDEHYVGVWHMSQDPNGDVADAMKDSTSNLNHGTPGGTMTTADLVDGKVGKAIEFDASDDRINVGDESSLEPSHLTFSYWAKPTTYDRSLNGGIAKGTIFGSSSGYSYRIDFNNGNAVGRVTDEGNSWYGTTVAIGDNDWHLWTLTYDGSKVCLWKDLTKHEGTTFSGVIDYVKDNNDFCIGARSSGDYSFDGIIDEVRVSNIAHSDSWLKATYYSNCDNLLSFEDPEYYLVVDKELGVDSTHNTAKIYGELPSESHDAYVTLYYGDSDAGTVKNNWVGSDDLGLKVSGATFNTTISGLVSFRTYYYKWYCTYSGSEPSEAWSPSYSFWMYQGRILKGTSSNYTAVWSEPDSTFYNTRFAAVSYGSGAALNIVKDDEIVGCYYATASGLGNGEIQEDVSDLISVR